MHKVTIIKNHSLRLKNSGEVWIGKQKFLFNLFCSVLLKESLVKTECLWTPPPPFLSLPRPLFMGLLVSLFLPPT